MKRRAIQNKVSKNQINIFLYVSRNEEQFYGDWQATKRGVTIFGFK